MTRRATSPLHGGTTSARFARRLIDAGVAGGVNRGVLLAAAHLTEADLTDPDGRVPLSAEVALWRVLGDWIEDPGFAVRMGSGIDLRHSGLFGYLVSYSSTLRDALRRVQRYGRLFSDASRWALGGTEQAVFSLTPSATQLRLRSAEEYRLAAVVRGCRDITGVDVVPLEVSFTEAPPVSTLAHHEFFRCPVRFNAPRAAIAFSPRDLLLPVARGDETLVGYLTRHAEHELMVHRPSAPMRDQVHAAIWSIRDPRPSMDAVASVLGVPGRTIQRRLAAEGTTFHREIEGILKAVAMASLRDGSVEIPDVAARLGYSEPSAFYRSFKRWTGTTPGDFRRRAA